MFTFFIYLNVGWFFLNSYSWTVCVRYHQQTLMIIDEHFLFLFIVCACMLALDIYFHSLLPLCCILFLFVCGYVIVVTLSFYFNQAGARCFRREAYVIVIVGCLLTYLLTYLVGWCPHKIYLRSMFSHAAASLRLRAKWATANSCL